MSNTAVVSSVNESSGNGSVGESVIGGCILGIASVAAWLCQETDEDRKAVSEYREARRRELLQRPFTAMDLQSVHQAWPKLKAESLHLSNPETLIQSAQHLGYRLEPLVDKHKPLINQPHIYLQKQSGERMALSFDKDRRIVLTTAGEDLRLRRLVRQHTLDQALVHVQKKGMQVRTATLPNGEVQILAREQNNRNRDGAAEIKVQVRNDGSAWIDVDRLQGKRCVEIVREFAEAVGGKVTETNMKDASFQLPGEPAKTNVKV